MNNDPSVSYYMLDFKSLLWQKNLAKAQLDCNSSEEWAKAAFLLMVMSAKWFLHRGMGISYDYNLSFKCHNLSRDEGNGIACPVRRGGSGESRLIDNHPSVCRRRHARFLLMEKPHVHFEERTDGCEKIADLFIK